MKFLLSIFFVFAYTTVSAQILKVDRVTLAVDTSNYWHGNVNFKFDLNNRAATVDREITFIGLNANIDVGFASTNHEYTIISNFRYFTTGVGPFVSTGYVHGRVNWLRKKKVSYETFAQVQYDRGRNLQVRYLVGSGVRVSFLRKKKSYFYAGFGVMYEQEQWKDFEGQLINIDLIKSTNYLSADFFFNKRIELNTVLYYQTGYSDTLDKFLHRINGAINFKIKVNERLDYLTSFQLQYEQTPIIQINRTVYALSNGLNFRFG